MSDGAIRYDFSCCDCQYGPEVIACGMIGQASAPGQIDVTKLKQILQTVQPTNPKS